MVRQADTNTIPNLTVLTVLFHIKYVVIYYK